MATYQLCVSFLLKGIYFLGFVYTPFFSNKTPKPNILGTVLFEMLIQIFLEIFTFPGHILIIIFILIKGGIK